MVARVLVRGRRRRAGRSSAPLVAGGVVLAGLLALLAVLATVGLPGLDPFGQRTVDRSPPPVLQAVRDLSRYTAATGDFQVVVDLERDVDNVPSVIAGERTLFLAQGGVDAYVDLGALGPEQVQVSEDRRTVRLVLPPPALSEPRVDPEQSRVVSRQRGVLDRVGGVFSDDPTSERQLYVRAQERMLEAARRGELLSTAEDNTRRMLTGLLTGLGFTDVTVEFEQDPRP